jgi:hypothetical protein
MRYDEFERDVPESIRTDTLWRMPVYRCALFLSELCWHDVSRLMNDPRTVKLAGELYDTVGRIGASLARLHSRAFAQERHGILDQCLAATRQSRHWYYKSRHLLREQVTDHRLNILGLIDRLLASLNPCAGGQTLHESVAQYGPNRSTPAHSIRLPELQVEAPLE